MAQKRAIETIFRCALAGLAASILGCAEERVLNPAPPANALYVALNARAPEWTKSILVIDCKTDSIVDSLPQDDGSNNWGEIFATKKPGVIIIPIGGVHKVLDLRSGTVAASLGFEFESVIEFPEIGRIVAARSDRMLVFDDTSYSVRLAHEWGLENCRRRGEKQNVIGRVRFNPTGGPPYGPLLTYSLSENRIIDSVLVDLHNDGRGFAFYNFTVSPDGSRIFGNGEVNGEAWVIGYDLETKAVLFKRPHVGISGPARCFLNPDGKELWVTWSPNIYGYPWPQSIHVLSASTGTLVDTVDLSGSTLNWPRPVSPSSYDSWTTKTRHMFRAGQMSLARNRS